MIPDNWWLGNLKKFWTFHLPTQFTHNSIYNDNNESLQVYADNNLILTLPPRSEGGYQLKGEKNVRYVSGLDQIYLHTLKNLKKKSNDININLNAIDNSKVSLEEMQSTVCCKVAIENDFLNQIQVKVNGPFYVQEVNPGVYDVRLRVCETKNQFDKIYGSKKPPYKVTFIITATDIVSGKTASKKQDFTFMSW